MWIASITTKSPRNRKDNHPEIYFGKVVWRNGDEFGFNPCGTTEVWWCKTDFWLLKEGILEFSKFTVIK